MDGNHSPLSHHHKGHSPPERDGSFNYDIESTDGGGGAWRDALMRYDDDGGPREPLLRKRTMNTTSQIAIVGANVCPVESLDYEYVVSLILSVPSCWYSRLLENSPGFQIKVFMIAVSQLW